MKQQWSWVVFEWHGPRIWELWELPEWKIVLPRKTPVLPL